VFGEFIRGVSPKGRVRADNYFDVVILKVRSYVMSRSVSRRQVVSVNTVNGSDSVSHGGLIY